MSTFYLVQQSEGLVRPGTSDALTARAIDATVHPVAQAGEAVAEVPRVVDSIPPQLVGGALGLSAVLLVIASQHGRMRLALAPMLMSGLLLLPVSNYQAPKPAVGRAVAEKPKSSGEPEWLRRHARAERPEPSPEEPRSFPSLPYPDFHLPDFHVPDFDLPDFERVASSELVEEALPLIELVVPEDWDRQDVKRFLRRNSERLRREVRRLRSEQAREERRARRHAYSMEHHHHHSR